MSSHVSVIVPFSCRELFHRTRVCHGFCYYYCFISLPVEGYLDCFQSGATVDKIAINVYVEVRMWTSCHFSRVNAQEGIAVLYGKTYV